MGKKIARRSVTGCLMVFQLAFVAGASAETPCDRLRTEFQTLAAQHPEATEDFGDGHFLNAVVGPKRDDRSEGISCESFADWLRKEGLDTSIANHLDEGDRTLCFTSLALYDHRDDGGFIALAGTEGSAHCAVVQVIDADKDQLRMGWSGDGDCYPATFGVIQVDGRAYPAMVRPKTHGTDLSYRLDLISVEPGNDECSVSIAYQPEFFGHWFGPKGENDVDPELRQAVEPIISALGAGRDVQALVKPWMDHPRGDSPYDLAIRGYPDQPVDGMRYPNTGDHVYSLPFGVPFLGGEYDTPYYENAYGTSTEDAAIPLMINGRRLLLTFGFATSPGTLPPDAGFGLWEYNDQRRDFDGIAGGIVGRRGINPNIE